MIVEFLLSCLLYFSMTSEFCCMCSVVYSMTSEFCCMFSMSHHGTMIVYFKSERSYTIHHSCKWTVAYFWCGPSWLGKCNIIINLVDVKLYKRCWWKIINRLWLNQSVAKLTWKVLSNAYLVMELMGVLMILLQIWFQVTSGEAKEQKTDVCGGFSESQPVGVHGVPCTGRGSMGQKVTC